MLAKILSIEDFGKITILLAVQWFALGFFDAAVLTPFTIKCAKKQEASAKKYIQRTTTVFLMAGIATVAIIVSVFFFTSPLLGLADASFVMLTGLFLSSIVTITREFARTVFSILSLNKISVAAEFLNSASMIIGLLAVWLFNKSITANIAIFLWALPIFGIAQLFRVGLVKTNLRHALYLCRLWLAKNSQAVVAAKITWIQSQGYIFLTSSMLNMAVLGLISMVRVGFSPLQTIVSGLTKGLLPDLTTFAAKKSHATLVSSILRIIIIYSLAVFAWTTIYYLVFDTFFVINIHEPPFNRIDWTLFLAWGASFWIGGVRLILGVALKARGEFQRLTYQSILGAITLLALSAFLVPNYSGVGAVWTLFGAEFTSALYAVRTILKKQLPKTN